MVAKADGCMDPQCFACTHSMEELEARERAAMEKEGWYAHMVVAEKEGDLANYHTHGLPHTFQHLDFQCVLPIDPNIVHGIVHTLVKQIRLGKVFEDGDVEEGLIRNGYSIKFVAAEENGRRVLRIVLPDKNNKLEPDEMAEPFDMQYGDLVQLKERPGVELWSIV